MAVTPEGRPLAVRVMLPVKPPTSVTVMVLVALLSLITETDAGEAVRVKLGAVLTVIEIFVLAVILPVAVSEAVAMAVWLPTGVVAVVVTVSVDVAADAPVTVAVGAEQVRPMGEPLASHAKLTCPVKPPEGVIVSVAIPLLPAVAVTGPLLVSAKLGTALTVTEVVWVALV